MTNMQNMDPALLFVRILHICHVICYPKLYVQNMCMKGLFWSFCL